VNSHSMPEMRGEPSARRVAIVLWRPASNSLRTLPANSGSACSTALHDGTESQHNREPTDVGGAHSPIHLRRSQTVAGAATGSHTVEGDGSDEAVMAGRPGRLGNKAATNAAPTTQIPPATKQAA
jgi:hypothetical protein